MKLLVIGANGQLGADIARVFLKENPVCLTHAEIEISDYRSVTSVFEKFQPTLVINTAAFHNVAECEREDLKAFMVNAIGPRLLAQNCVKFSAGLIHISTDYVFDGAKKKPYHENDFPHPLNVYGISKLAGEHFISAIMPKYWIIRTSGLYGLNRCRGKEGNFIDTMLRLYKEKKEIRVVNDEFLSPTYTLDLAEKIKDVLESGNFGIFHITNSGSCSWFEFAEEIFNLLRLKVKIHPAKSEEFSSCTQRPTYSVLANTRLEASGLGKLRHWKTALKSFLGDRTGPL